jgi:hypothetical protein
MAVFLAPRSDLKNGSFSVTECHFMRLLFPEFP